MKSYNFIISATYYEYNWFMLDSTNIPFHTIHISSLSTGDRLRIQVSKDKLLEIDEPLICFNVYSSPGFHHSAQNSEPKCTSWVFFRIHDVSRFLGISLFTLAIRPNHLNCLFMMCWLIIQKFNYCDKPKALFPWHLVCHLHIHTSLWK